MIFYMMIFCSKIRTQTPKSEEKTMTENQISYQNHEQEEEIDLVSLLFTVLRKYRQMLAVALACAVIFGAVAGIQTSANGAVSADAQEEYDAAMTEYRQKKADYDAAVRQYKLDTTSNEQAQADTQKALEDAQTYAEHSMLSNLDAHNVWTARADLYIKTNYQIMPGSVYQNPDNTSAVVQAYANLLVNGDAMDKAADALKLQARFLREVVTAEPVQNANGTYSGLLTLRVNAADQNSAEKILNELLGHLDEVQASISAAIGSHTVATVAQSCSRMVSTDLLAQQQAQSDNIAALQTQMQTLQAAREQLDETYADTQANWATVSEPVFHPALLSSIVKFALIGFVVGVFVVAGIVCVQFLAAGRVYSAKELKRSCGLPILGALASEKSKTAQKLDAALNRAEGRPNGSTDAEMLCLMAETIRSRAPQARRVLVTGDLPAEQLTALAAALQATDALRSVTVTAAESILKAAATVQQVNLADSIVLAADCACSRYAAVNDQNEQIRRLGKSVLGCIVFE